MAIIEIKGLKRVSTSPSKAKNPSLDLFKLSGTFTHVINCTLLPQDNY